MWFKKRQEEKVNPNEDPTSIGRLLLDNNLITKEELDFAIQHQKEKNDYLLGEILIESGILDKGIVEAMLVVQKAKRGNGVELNEAVEYLLTSNKLVGEKHKNFLDILNEIKSFTKKVAL